MDFFGAFAVFWEALSFSHQIWLLKWYAHYFIKNWTIYFPHFTPEAFFLGHERAYLALSLSRFNSANIIGIYHLSLVLVLTCKDIVMPRTKK